MTNSYPTGACGQIVRRLTPEDAIDVAGHAPVLVRPIRSVQDQAAVGPELRGVDRGQ
jgi:hypothetical protein